MIDSRFATHHTVLLKSVIISALAALVLYHAGPAAASLDLPDIGDTSAAVISSEEDRLLGQAFMRSVRRSLDIVESPQINTYINALGYRLLAGVDTRHTQFTFFVVNDPDINAFAGPGGYIGIHSGLILAAESEGELAAVMAHEIAHVTQRHLARAFEKASTINLQTAAAILAAIILGVQDAQLGQAVLAASTAGSIQQQLNFTRDHEKEADRIGIDILAQAGYDPRHMPAFFQKLQESLRYMESGAPELLRTHPVALNRIADSMNRAELYPHQSPTPRPEFDLIQSKLRVATLADQAQRQRALAADMANTPAPSRTLRFEYARTLLINNAPDQARSIAATLLEDAPENIDYITLQAEIEIAGERYQAAEQRLADALRLYPNYPSLSVLYAETLMKRNDPAKAITVLRQLIETQQQFTLPSYYQLLAQAQDQNRQFIEARLTMAEYYYQIGLTRTAINQLESALQQLGVNAHYQRARINDRLEVLKQEALAEEALFK